MSRTQNKKIIHSNPLRYMLDGKAVLGQPQGMRGQKLTITILTITALEHHFEDLVQAVTDAGVSILDVVAAPVATSLSALTPQQKMAGVLLVDIGAETVSMAVFENNHMISMEVFAIGSTDITNDIALGFQVPLEEAESIKTGRSIRNKDFSKSRLLTIVESRLLDIFELVDDHLKKIKRSGLLPAGVIITGGGSRLATIEDFAKTTLQLPSRVMRVGHIVNSPRKLADSSWFVAYGLCFLGLDHDTSISFTRSWKQIGKKFSSFFGELMP